MRVWVFLVVLVSVGACANGATQAPPSFAPGASAASEVRFDSFETYDWQAGATPAALGFDPHNLTGTQVEALFARHYDFSRAEFEYALAASERTRKSCYRLLSGSGIHSLTYRALRGVARYQLDEQTHTVFGPTFFGHAYATSAVTESGIVMRTDTCERSPRLAPSRTTLQRTAANGARLEFDDGERVAEITLGPPWFRGIVAAYAFTLSGRRYLFVQWTSDDDGELTPLCASNFTIFMAEDVLREVAGANFDCDV